MRAEVMQGARHGSRRPLPPRVAGERDSVVRIDRNCVQDPCQLVWQVNEILHAPRVWLRNCLVDPKESFSPAIQGGRGRFACGCVLTCESPFPTYVGTTRGGRGRTTTCVVPP